MYVYGSRYLLWFSVYAAHHTLWFSVYAAHHTLWLSVYAAHQPSECIGRLPSPILVL